MEKVSYKRPLTSTYSSMNLSIPEHRIQCRPKRSWEPRQLTKNRRHHAQSILVAGGGGLVKVDEYHTVDVAELHVPIGVADVCLSVNLSVFT